MSEALSRLLEPIDGKPGPFSTWARFDRNVRIELHEAADLMVSGWLHWPALRPDVAMEEARRMIALLSFENKRLRERAAQVQARPSVVPAASVDETVIASLHEQYRGREARDKKRIAELEAALKAQRGRG